MWRRMLELRVTGPDGAALSMAEGEDEIFLVHDTPYSEGTVLNVGGHAGTFIVMTLADTLPPALVYLRDGRFAFPVPFGQRARAYSPRAFVGGQQRLHLRRASEQEVALRRDLALNPYDHPDSTIFPHAHATAETRDEACFAARTAIDGEIANDRHGCWPYTSWGIAQNPQAALTVEFGREVVIDEIALTLRADFPHDSWWRSARVTFGAGDVERLALRKTGRRQAFPVAPRRVTHFVLHDLERADDPSPFPALTRLEATGVEGGETSSGCDLSCSLAAEVR